MERVAVTVELGMKIILANNPVSTKQESQIYPALYLAKIKRLNEKVFFFLN